MYDQANTPCFDPNNMSELSTSADNIEVIESPEESGLTQRLEDLQLHDHQVPIIINNPSNHIQEIMDPSMGLQNIQNPNSDTLNHHHEPNNWTPTNIVEMGFPHYNDHEIPTSILTLLHLPSCSFPPPPTPSISFGKPVLPSALGFLGELNNPIGISDNPSGSGSNIVSYDPAGMPYDPLFHLNLPPQPSPLLRDLMFQSLPLGFGGIRGNENENENENGNGNGINSSNSLFGGLEEGGGEFINGINYNDGDHHQYMHASGIFEFTSSACLGEGKEGKCPKNFVTERQRRQNFNDKYSHLRQLVPNPTKPDRASIVKDAIDYIQELKRTVGELKLLVEKKKISKEIKANFKRHKSHDQDTASSVTEGVDQSSGVVKPKPDPDDQGFNGGSAVTQLRSSWLQRKCKDTEVDVRIVDDDITIKLVQRKKINCLLAVSRTLDELQLDLCHVAGGHVGDYYSYLFNTKICEGSSVYASAIANKMIEVVERQYAAAASSSAASVSIPPTCRL